MECKTCKFYQPWSVGQAGACDEIISRNRVEYIATGAGDVEPQYLEVSEDFFCAYFKKGDGR